jgi:hypothetical protein
MQEHESDSTLMDLPFEVIHAILHACSMEALLTLAASCRTLRQAICCPELGRFFLRSQWAPWLMLHLKLHVTIAPTDVIIFGLSPGAASPTHDAEEEMTGDEHFVLVHVKPPELVYFALWLGEGPM